MSRNVVLFAGAMAWTGVVIDTFFHVAIGDPVIPVVFGLVSVGWIALRRPQLALRKAT